MVEMLANITQVINNSPHVGSLVGGQMAAEDVARQQAQASESRRQQMELQKKVLALEKANFVEAVNPEDRQRQETRRERKNRLKAERESRQAAERRARADRAAKNTGNEGAGCAASPFSAQPVIDVCV